MPAETVAESALAFTHGDRFKPLPGYQVMGSHYHVGLVPRLKEIGGLDNRLNDVEAMKGAGINIYGVIDGVRGRASGDAYLQAMAEYYDAARRQSDKNFLVMPNKENTGIDIGGHHDLMLSKPVFYRPQRAAGQPFVEKHPKFGNVYNLGSPADLMEMTKRENAIISMPHPRSKGSTGYPEAIKDSAHFLHENYHGMGYRWGMGVDASETPSVRVPLSRPVRRDEQLDDGAIAAAQVHAGDLRGPVGHRSSRQAALRRHLRRCRRSTT